MWVFIKFYVIICQVQLNILIYTNDVQTRNRMVVLYNPLSNLDLFN